MLHIKTLATVFSLAIALAGHVAGQANCPLCQSCNVTPNIQIGTAGPARPSGTGVFPSVPVPTFDVSLGTLTGLRITITAEAINRKFTAENTYPVYPCPGGDPTSPATLDIVVDVRDPSNTTTLLHVTPSVDPSWHVEDVFPALGAFDCCVDYGVCFNDPGLGHDYRCCPGCPSPIQVGPLVPTSCSPSAPPPCTTPGPQASGYHRTFPNAAFAITTNCITTNLGAYLSTAGPTVSFPVSASGPENTGSSLCAGSIDKHWNSQVRVTVRVEYTYCPSTVNYSCPFCFGDNAQPIPCPCSNTGQGGRGCNNSEATGGAILSAAADPNLGTTVLTTGHLLDHATCIFLQGSALLSQPTVFGDGLRCIGGNLLRLYVGHASNGTASAPGVGEPSIMDRSAELGDPFTFGMTRYYQTYYRDSNPTYCPTPQGDTWNISSALYITW